MDVIQLRRQQQFTTRYIPRDIDHPESIDCRVTVYNYHRLWDGRLSLITNGCDTVTSSTTIDDPLRRRPQLTTRYIPREIDHPESIDCRVTVYNYHRLWDGRLSLITNGCDTVKSSATVDDPAFCTATHCVETDVVQPRDFAGGVVLTFPDVTAARIRKRGVEW
ncbi:hypothetical protein J6590_058245 [Homalodisca vitripennis]|nr:hypothetical protein J6590_058245 [Homalodisca vitripennis]